MIFKHYNNKNKKTVNNVKVVVKMSQYYKIHNAREYVQGIANLYNKTRISINKIAGSNNRIMYKKYNGTVGNLEWISIFTESNPLSKCM